MIGVPDTGFSTPSFGEEIKKRATVLEVAFLLAVPTFLILVHLLPEPTRETLVFQTSRPGIASAFIAHYVHLTDTHLLGNLIIYVGAVGVGYPLAVLGGIRQVYLSLVVAILLGFPFVLSALHLTLLGTGGIVGFSGLALALIGILPVVLFVYLGARIEGAVSVNDAPALFFIGIAIIAWRTAAPEILVSAIVIGSIVVAVLYLIPLLHRLAREGRTTRPQRLRPGYVELPVAVVLLFILALVAGFPANPIGNTGSVTNLLIHLVAYTLGFIGGYVTDRSLRILALPNPPPPPPPD